MSFVKGDAMHTLDLGVTQDVCACALAEIVEHKAGWTRTLRVASLWQELRAWYRVSQAPSRLTRLTWETLQAKPGQPPRLRAKAAECRYLLPFVVEQCRPHRDTPHAQTRYRALWALLEVYQGCGDDPYDAASTAAACRRFLSHASALAQEATAQGSAYWRLRPKHHLMFHIFCHTAPQHGSPNSFWVYADERHVGLISSCARRRGGPHGLAAVATDVVQRYRASMREMPL
jgi:hypothetical protein